MVSTKPPVSYVLTITRSCSVFLLITGYLVTIYLKGYFTTLTDSMKYLTYWSHNIELMFFMLLLKAIKDNKHLSKSEFQKYLESDFISELFSILLGIQFLITIFFWAILFKLENWTNSTIIFTEIYFHSLPFLFIIIEYSLNSMKMKWFHLKYMVIFLVFYMSVNLIIVKFTGKPVYRPMDFKTWKTLIYVGLGLVMSVFGWGIFKYSEKYKFASVPRTTPQMKKTN